MSRFLVDPRNAGVEEVVRVEHLTKRFPQRRGVREIIMHPSGATRTTVLNDVSFIARAGEFLGLLGPNGAGKTTLLKILSTLVLPDEGSVMVDGHDVVDGASSVRALVSSCLAQERSLHYRLTARENLEVFADLQGVPRPERAGRVEEVLSAVALRDTGTKLVGQFSSGMMQRLLIARALLTRPRLLLLDEPTRSLDPVSARDFRRFLREELARERGCAVILATHNAEEAFELCDRVGVLNQGRLLAAGVARELAREFLGTRYRVVTDDSAHPAFADLEASGLAKIVANALAEAPAGWPAVTLDLAEAEPSMVLSRIVASGARVSAFEPLRPSLADLIEGVVAKGDRA